MSHKKIHHVIMYETYLFILSEKKIMLFMVSIFCINCNNYVINMNLKTLNLQAQVNVLTVTKLALDFNRLKALTTHLWHRFICHTWLGTCNQGTCIHTNTHSLWPSLTYAYTRHPFDIISPMFIFHLLTMAVARLILMEWTSSKTG